MIQPLSLSDNHKFDEAISNDLQKQRDIWCSVLTLNVCVVLGYWELALVHQLIAKLQGRSGDRKQVRVRIVAIVDTKNRTMLFGNTVNDSSVDSLLSNEQQAFINGKSSSDAVALDVDALQQYLLTASNSKTENYSVLIDCSDNEEIYRTYPSLTSKGVRVITQQRTGCLINDMDVVPLLQTLFTYQQVLSQ